MKNKYENINQINKKNIENDNKSIIIYKIENILEKLMKNLIDNKVILINI
jgi:hypothetical protein